MDAIKIWDENFFITTFLLALLANIVIRFFHQSKYINKNIIYAFLVSFASMIVFTTIAPLLVLILNGVPIQNFVSALATKPLDLLSGLIQLGLERSIIWFVVLVGTAYYLHLKNKRNA